MLVFTVRQKKDIVLLLITSYLLKNELSERKVQDRLLFIIVFSGLIVVLITLIIIRVYESKKYPIKMSDDDIVTPPSYKMITIGYAFRHTMRTYRHTLNKINAICLPLDEDFSSLSENQIIELYSLCRKNIYAYQKRFALDRANEQTVEENVPAYKYISIIYEMDEDYENAIYACRTALKLSACKDKEKEKMVERIIRLSKEGNIELSEEVQGLIKNE